MTLLQKIFTGKSLNRIPVWFMRQAGRYLPEYKKLRQQAGSFISLCYNPEYACEASLQPIRRFDFDAAIVFSDILVIPDALGQSFEVKEDVGPILKPAIRNPEDLQKLSSNNIGDNLAPVYEAISMVRDKLSKDKSLIGFCGAPFTIASYMIAGGADAEAVHIRRFYHDYPEAFKQLLDILTDCCIEHLQNQIRAGADVIQIFESAGGFLNDVTIADYSISPISRICAVLKRSFSDIPIIIFPRGATSYHADYVRECDFNGFSVDVFSDIGYLSKQLPSNIVLQGNLNPLSLFEGGIRLSNDVRQILVSCSGRSLIFNLGHGVMKSTPLEHIYEVLRFLRRDGRVAEGAPLLRE